MRYCHQCWHEKLGVERAAPGQCGYDEHVASLPEGPFECDGCGDGVVTVHPTTAAYFLNLYRRDRSSAERAMTHYAIALSLHRLN
jgi:hypothetical protein